MHEAVDIKPNQILLTHWYRNETKIMSNGKVLDVSLPLDPKLITKFIK